jgi:hypothetical protein
VRLLFNPSSVPVVNFHFSSLFYFYSLEFPFFLPQFPFLLSVSLVFLRKKAEAAAVKSVVNISAYCEEM